MIVVFLNCTCNERADKEDTNKAVVSHATKKAFTCALNKDMSVQERRTSVTLPQRDLE